MNNKKSTSNRVDCFKCIYFQITWDKNKPYGCKKIGFKSKIMPSLYVFRTSGKKCLAFCPKK